MDTTQQTETTRQEILDALLIHINKRTGMDIRDYASDWGDVDGVKCFRSEYRSVVRDGQDARTLLSYVWRHHYSISTELLIRNATNGERLEYKNHSFSYCVGQYWPTEYRSAACRYLRNCIVQGFRADGKSYDEIKKLIRNELGRGIVNRWFN